MNAFDNLNMLLTNLSNLLMFQHVTLADDVQTQGSNDREQPIDLKRPTANASRPNLIALNAVYMNVVDACI